ncbi:MAG: adenylate/guanylate cyclase domain-containing protein [Myxococcaceae bacterium]
MWQIIINGPGYFDTPYDLPDGVTTLGRAEENDIVLSGDLVSRRHARFHAKGDDLQVEDLGSRNGSKLNGQPLTGQVVVKPGDIVSVGENSLAIRQPAQVENAATEMVDVGAGGVRFFGQGTNIGNSVLLSRNVTDSVVLKALDNVTPFELSNPFADEERDDKTPPPMQMGNLFLLYKTAELLATSKSLQAFLENAIDRFLERIKASTAVVLVRHSSGTLVPATVRHGGQLAKGEVPVSDAIVAEALSKGTALVVSDVRDDARFRERESVVMYGADQVVCVPLGKEAPFKGVLYLNLKGQNPTHLEQILDLTTALSYLIATALEKFQVTDKQPQLDRFRRTLERFHPHDVVEKRLAEFQKGGALRFTHLEEKPCTILCCEIASFSKWQQGNRPDQVGELLNDFYQRFTGIVFSFEGSVSGSMGEGMMAVFGAPYGKPDEALRAVRSALALKVDWDRQMAKRPEIDRLRLRIGLSTGKVAAGLVGIETRLEFTAVGDAVTAAASLCGSADAGQILVTGKTLALIGARFDVTPLGERALKGGALKLPVFEVLEEDMAALTSPGIR